MDTRKAMAKCSTVFRILRQHGVLAVLRATAAKIVKVTSYRLDMIAVGSTETGPQDKVANDFDVRFALPDDLRRLFEQWPDSREELERHRRVVEVYGFNRCLLVIDRRTNRVAHFQFLITVEDSEKVKRWLPWQMDKRIWRPDYGWQEWLYTFEDYRRLGLSVAGLRHLIAHCRQVGISRLYSHRGVGNVESVNMADKVGYRRIGTIYQVNLFGTERLSKMFVALRADLVESP